MIAGISDCGSQLAVGQTGAQRTTERGDVPYNALHDSGYPSIGCDPCTRAIRPGEDIRAGRWWWETKDSKECGIHVSPLVKPTGEKTS